MVGLAQPMPKRRLSLGDKKPARPTARSSQKQRELTLRNNKFKMLRGEGSIARRRSNKRCKENAKGMSKEDVEEIERLREERRTKRRNDPISSESELGEFEIGVNVARRGRVMLSK
ncbi:unnamed protein product [Microthlaspi erraticum]|uniref:Uncharacterized protein n=1 Tax=Microthlaspi erraticum TaxID=1685480 RepID=A0A6D2KBH2_9BRAS|nr:unnamed protein product [Microthlaspi erraticum]